MFSSKFKETIAKSISVLSLSFFAFQNTAFGLSRYAKVVVLGSIGSGKSTFKEIFKQNFSKPDHTKQLNNLQIPVFYNKKGEFTFDEEKAYGKYKNEVILTICDTPADKPVLDCVNDFVSKGTVVLVLLADARNFKNNWDGCEYCSHFMEVLKKFKSTDCRKILILSHCSDKLMGKNIVDNFTKFMTKSQLLAWKKLGAINVDEVKVLTLFNGPISGTSKKKQVVKDKDEESFIRMIDEINIGEELKDEELKDLEPKEDKDSLNKTFFGSLSNSFHNWWYKNDIKNEIKTEIKIEPKIQKPKNVITNEANFQITADDEEKFFNKNSKEELIEYGKLILNLIAKSVWKYGFDKLPLDSSNTNYHIEDKMGFKVGKKTTKVWGLFKDTEVESDKVETFYKPSLTAGNK